MDLTHTNLWTDRIWAAGATVDVGRHQTPENLGAVRTAVIDAHARGVRRPAIDVRYPPVSPDVVASLARLEEELATASGDLVDLPRRSLALTVGALRALASRRPEDVTAHGLLAHGRPTAELLADAQAVLSVERVDVGADAPPLPVERVVGAIEEVLGWLGVTGWSVVVRNASGARLRVSAQHREVRVSAGAHLTADELRGLVVHEVGTHVLRAVAGDGQPLRLLSRGLPGYLETEEGLATHHELRVADAPGRLRTFALRVVAADAALRGGIMEVMAALTEHVTAEAAFPIAFRAKRGMDDLHQPGSPCKDVVYLRGLRRVEAHLRSHPEDHPLLMSGKLGLDDLPLAHQLVAEGLLVVPPSRVEDLIAACRAPHPPWSTPS